MHFLCLKILCCCVKIFTMKCADDDECSALGEAACSGGRCVNTHGSFTCECGPGSVLDSTGEPMH